MWCPSLVSDNTEFYRAFLRYGSNNDSCMRSECNLVICVTVVKQITHSVDDTDRLFTVVLLYNIHQHHGLQHFKVVVNITCTDSCTQPRRP